MEVAVACPVDRGRALGEAAVRHVLPDALGSSHHCGETAVAAGAADLPAEIGARGGNGQRHPSNNAGAKVVSKPGFAMAI